MLRPKRARPIATATAPDCTLPVSGTAPQGTCHNSNIVDVARLECDRNFDRAEKTTEVGFAVRTGVWDKDVVAYDHSKFACVSPWFVEAPVKFTGTPLWHSLSRDLAAVVILPPDIECRRRFYQYGAGHGSIQFGRVLLFLRPFSVRHSLVPTLGTYTYLGR